MFDAVLGRENKPRRRLATSAVVSVVTYSAILGAALIVSGAHRSVDVEPPVLKFYQPHAAALPPAPHGSDAPAVHPATHPAAHPHVKKLVAPVVVPPPVVEEQMPPTREQTEVGELISDGDTHSENTSGELGDGAGDPNSNCYGPQCTGTPGNGGGGTDVMSFGAGMTQPTLLEGRQPQFTREALEAHVSGLMLVKCVILTDGRLEHCRVIKPLSHMSDEVLGALATQRYTPVTQDGHPVAVDYLFKFRFVAR